jgi:hypothetical protein
LPDFQTVLDHVAQVIGGSQPDAANRPRWFSGRDVGDSTGLVPGGSYPVFTGCYSAPPEAIEDVPVALVLPGNFEVGGPQNRDVYYQGEEYNVDDLRVLIFVYRIDSETDIANLMPYRDLMPAAFAAKMSAFSTASILQAMVRGGKPANITYAGISYSGWEFTVRVIRMVSRTYAP